MVQYLSSRIRQADSASESIRTTEGCGLWLSGTSGTRLDPSTGMSRHRLIFPSLLFSSHLGLNRKNLPLCLTVDGAKACALCLCRLLKCLGFCFRLLIKTQPLKDLNVLAYIYICIPIHPLLPINLSHSYLFSFVAGLSRLPYRS